MTSDRWLRAKRDRVTSAKYALEQLIKAIDREFVQEEVDPDKVRLIVDGRVEAVDTARIILVGIIDQDDPDLMEYVRQKVEELAEASWSAFNTLLMMMNEEIPENYDNYKLRAISDGKRKAFEQADLVLQAIQQLYEAIEGEEVQIVKEDAILIGHLERRAKTLSVGKQKKRGTRNRN